MTGLAQKRILLIGNDKRLHRSLTDLFSGTHRILSVRTAASAFALLDKDAIDLILLDHANHGMDGMEFLRRLKLMDGNADVIVVAAAGSVRSAVQAMKLGASDYIVKPWEAEELRAAVRRVLERRSLERTIVDKSKNSFEDIVTCSPRMEEVFDTVRRVCAAETRVLIVGETGTGKELIARAIHENGTRKGKPFVAVNCAAIPATLLESELFGHEQGAFSDARNTRKGKFELANRGTLLLDEVSSLSLDMQAKLLRTLQEGTIERLGSERVRRVDVRVVAATNNDIRQMVDAGEFRGDLYFRLNVVPILLPPLRERKEDIPLLTNHFLECFNKKHRKNVLGFSKNSLALLADYHWPGNVRELENLVERLVALGENGRKIAHSQLPVDMLLPRNNKQEKRHPSGAVAYDAVVNKFEREYILQALHEARWNQSRAARMIRMHRNTLVKKVRQLNLHSFIKRRSL